MLLTMTIRDFGCIGPEGLTIDLNRIVCLVGANNAGKSTVLRAYELAVTSGKLEETDRCLHSAADATPRIELALHIPIGTPNIGDEWIDESGGIRKLTSRWTWPATGGVPKRETYHPIDKWDHQRKASGLDAVFTSRLPKPFRIGSLDGPEDEEKKLINAVLDPIAKELRRRQTEDGDLRQKLAAAFEAAEATVKELSDDLAEAERNLNQSLANIFPTVPVEFRPSLGDGTLDLAPLLTKNSNLRIQDQGKLLPTRRQGTGTQRALFWSLLAVRAGVERVFATRRAKIEADHHAKSRAQQLPIEIQEAERLLETANSEVKQVEQTLATETAPRKKEAAEKRLAKARKSVDEAKEQLTQLQREFAQLESRCGELDAGGPGYMLLIDEPETAMHPNAIRAARDYLYKLAEEDGWQVMLTTHSPVFVDPTLDHTTIVRLERTDSTLTPRTFRTDSAKLSGEERDQLKQLMHFDTGLAEMFFGGYPIVIEGDTEFAAFSESMRLDPSFLPVDRRPVLIRARGKDSIVLVVRVLRHFRVGFSVLHDSDGPRTIKGTKSSAWEANSRIYAELVAAHRDDKLRVIHHVSVPDFERECGLTPHGKDKPWWAFKSVREDATVLSAVTRVLRSLLPDATAFAPLKPDGPEAQQDTAILAKSFLTTILQPRVESYVEKTGIRSKEFDFSPAEDDGVDSGDVPLLRYRASHGAHLHAEDLDH